MAIFRLLNLSQGFGARLRTLAPAQSGRSMDFILAELARHGYAILFVSVFLEAIGFPVPAAIALLLAGAASAHGSLSAVATLGGSFLIILIGDTLMFLLGRYSGCWLLGLLCRFTLNPESCILRSADAFYKRGRALLVFAKFVPGINTMAPPLAGSMNMRIGQFLPLDFAGATLYVGAYLSAGFLFSGALAALTHGYHIAGRRLGFALVAAV